MECNKEEAVRAKVLAEKKMQNKDFIGAQKIALKAQQLFPYLENISQILTVCEVHCSAAVKINGEMDWYKILQIQPTADESSIKKQYRKLALVLHPDKNQFSGAEAAFKLIGEAQRTLLDGAKRHLYDIKRNANVKTIPPRPPGQPARNARTNFSTVNFNGLNQQQQQQSFTAAQTFWTMCPFCGMRYQYYRSTLNKALCCQSCMKPFIAHDLNAKAVPTGVNPGYHWSNHGIPPHQIPVPQTNNINHQSQHGSTSFATGLHANASGMSGKNSEQRGGHAHRSTEPKVNFKGTSANEVNFTNIDSAKVDQSKHSSKSSNANAGQKRGRKVVIDSSDSDSSDQGSNNVASDVPFEMKYESTSTPPRRSSRRRQNVIYREGGSEDEEEFAYPPSKRSNHDGTDMDNDKMQGKQKKHILQEEEQSNQTKKVKEDVIEGTKEGSSMKEKSELGAGSATASGLENSADQQQHTYSYPDPEFYDFEKFKETIKFEIDQIWAIYDNLDGMPRFYARIRKIETSNSNFSLRFTWLEHNSASKVEAAWSDAELPVACGNYRLGKSETSEDRLMFSHLVTWEKGKKKNSYAIYPRAGEVWALFRNWNISWISDADSHREYEYEVVEVLSNFTEGYGISVIPLVKIEGFVSLFIRARDDSFIIRPDEILKFSHNVPFYKLTDKDRKDLPNGCLELDCASLPTNFLKAFPSVSLDSYVFSANEKAEKKELGSCSKDVDGGTSQDFGPSKAKVIDLEASEASGYDHPEVCVTRQACQSETHNSNKYNASNINVCEGLSKEDAVEIDSLSQDPESPMAFDFPETEFHHFDDEKNIEKFERGQIWALYSDEDNYPKYYGHVKKFDRKEGLVHIIWLESCSEQEEEKNWSKEGIPLTCGIFKVSRETAVYDTTAAFSHLVAADQIATAQYKILPRVKEIWAVYKNWRIGWSMSDFKNCEYDVVEIFEDSGSCMKVNILTKVNGYRAVFCRERDGIAACTMVIPDREYTKFSHRIPAFHLTNEGGGKLMGCWELDTASVPQALLSSSSQ